MGENGAIATKADYSTKANGSTWFSQDMDGGFVRSSSLAATFRSVASSKENKDIACNMVLIGGELDPEQYYIIYIDSHLGDQ